MPKTVAWAGVLGGVWIVLADRLGMRLRIGAIALYVIGALCIGWALHLTLKAGDRPAAASAFPNNTIGDVTGNKGIITQGQIGNNKMGK